MINRRDLVAGLGVGAATIGAGQAFAQALVTVTLWHYQTGNRDALREVLNKFESLNPGIKVTDVLKSTETLASELQAAALANRAPDIGQVLGRLIVPNLAMPLAVFLLRQHLLIFPRELYDAAAIDGAGDLLTMWHVVLPNVKPFWRRLPSSCLSTAGTSISGRCL